MHLSITMVLFLILESINNIGSQGLPVSPCPKMFQYRFDGAEWFGLLSVRNPDFGQPLHLRVTLSMRGKPTTNYLGEIELLTRGQFLSDTPILYKVKFPKHHFPPKLLQITTNNQVVCLGAADHSIFVTQIQLEHTRKLTFIPDEMSLPMTPTFSLPTTQQQLQHQGAGISSSPSTLSGTTASLTAGVKESSLLLPSNQGFGTKNLPFTTFEKIPLRSSKDICGTIDQRIRFQVLHSIRFPSGSKFDTNVKFNPAGDIFPREKDDEAVSSDEDVDIGSIGANPNIMPTFVDDIDDISNGGSSLTNDEQPPIARGAWPWLAAIYVNNLTSLTYQCGGTLVSTRVVISSAHCFHMFKKRYTANEILVFLGRHNLKNWNEDGSLAAPVDDIFIHPDYDQHLSTYDADIAVIILKNEVKFSTFIRPACMWSGSTKKEYIEGEHGVVVAWGLGGMNATKAASMKATVPKIIHAPIVSNEACFKANDKFRSLSSNRTFCAGVVANIQSSSQQKHQHSQKKQQQKSKLSTTRLKILNSNGNQETANSQNNKRRFKGGPCTGDSGAGLMIFKNNRWMLRGTVSASLPVTNEPHTIASSSKNDNNDGVEQKTSSTSSGSHCNVNQYVIYTDVAMFLDWIFAFII